MHPQQGIQVPMKAVPQVGLQDIIDNILQLSREIRDTTETIHNKLYSDAYEEDCGKLERVSTSVYSRLDEARDILQQTLDQARHTRDRI